MKHFKRFFLLYTLIPLVLVALSANYYRFMVSYEYQVIHEGYCDPFQEKCFMYCEDDECLNPFYYTNIHRSAKELLNMCGSTLVSECEIAQECQFGEQKCSTEYCESGPDITCENLEITDIPRETGLGVGEIEVTSEGI